jgi:hypothetical protein
MSDHDKRRFEDTVIGKIIYSWPAIVGIVCAIFTLGKAATILSTLAEASSKSASFQEEQNGINAKLQTLLDTHENRIQSLESWRNGMDYWNRGKAQRGARDAGQ